MVSRPRVPARRRVFFKAVLFLLLAVNTAYFAIYATASKGIDAAAWLTLFVLFEAETSFADRLSSARAKAALRLLRLVAAAGVFTATIGYVFEDNALDAVNSALWIAVVVLLELELRFPRVAARHRGIFGAAAVALYGGLGLLVALWALRGMWIDAYDAALWLTAFATLELDILRRSG
jgi:hypothetical protein